MKKATFSKEKTAEIINYYLVPHSLNDTTKFAGITKSAVIKKLLLMNNVKLHSKETCVKLQQKKSSRLEELLKNKELLENIKQDYLEHNLQYKEMLEKYELSWATFARLLKKLGLKKDKAQQTANITKNKLAKYCPDKNELQKYFDVHTVEDTGKHFNIPIHFLYKVLNTLEIDWTAHKKAIPNGSTPENSYYKKLVALYGAEDIIRQYRDARYPFKCDFYIKSEDLFIELNLHWTHGGHPFDEADPEDLNKLNVWKIKAKADNFYKTAVKVWSISDPLKLKTFKENQLNYKIIYPTD